jgi:hypothetical protein
MTKDEMISLLRMVGCEEKTITAMSNAFDIGVDFAQGKLLALPVKEEKWVEDERQNN